MIRMLKTALLITVIILIMLIKDKNGNEAVLHLLIVIHSKSEELRELFCGQKLQKSFWLLYCLLCMLAVVIVSCL